MENNITTTDIWAHLVDIDINDSLNRVIYLVKDYETFEVAGIEFIKFPSVLGKTPVLSKDILFNYAFGESNNLADSDSLLHRLTEILTQVESVLGSKNVLEFNTDLIALDGMKEYGVLESKISLPTVDFIRNNAEILDKYNPGASYWTATPFSVRSRDYTRNVCYVRSDGVLRWSDCCFSGGVRPFLMLNSSIFESLR